MQVNRAYSVGTRSVKAAHAGLTDLPIEKLNESLVLGVSESGEAESFPLQIKNGSVDRRIIAAKREVRLVAIGIRPAELFF